MAKYGVYTFMQHAFLAVTNYSVYFYFQAIGRVATFNPAFSL